MNTSMHRQPPARAKTFAELFGLDEPGARRDNPGRGKSGRGKTSKRGASKRSRSFSGATPSVGRGAAKKSAKRGAAKSAGCSPKRRCPPTGPRFVLRSIGRSFTGIWDHQAGMGTSSRGRYVKRGDLECGSEKGASATYTLEMLIDSEKPELKKERRGPWEIWKDTSGNWLVYDRRTATLEERTFLQRAQVLRYISSGRAQRDTCPPKPRSKKAASGKRMSRRDNPGHDYEGHDRLDNPARAGRRDGYLTGPVVDVSPRKSGSVEARLDRLETRVDGIDVRVTRTESGLGRALNIIAGKPLSLGAGGKPARKASKRGKRS